MELGELGWRRSTLHGGCGGAVWEERCSKEEGNWVGLEVGEWGSTVALGNGG